MLVMEVAKIGNYLKDRRALLGKTQQQIAVDAETSAAYISQLEGGRVGLPNPDLRRRLAAALGVSHLDILIAAGEITEAEVREAGVPDRPPVNARVARLVERLALVPATDKNLTALERIVDALVELRPLAGEPVQHAPHPGDDVGVVR